MGIKGMIILFVTFIVKIPGRKVTVLIIKKKEIEIVS